MGLPDSPGKPRGGRRRLGLVCSREGLPEPNNVALVPVLKEISPEYSLEGLMLRLKLQYFGCLMGRTDSLENTLMLRKIEGGRRRG